MRLPLGLFFCRATAQISVLNFICRIIIIKSSYPKAPMWPEVNHCYDVLLFTRLFQGPNIIQWHLSELGQQWKNYQSSCVTYLAAVQVDCGLVGKCGATFGVLVLINFRWLHQRWDVYRHATSFILKLKLFFLLKGWYIWQIDRANWWHILILC